MFYIILTLVLWNSLNLKYFHTHTLSTYSFLYLGSVMDLYGNLWIGATQSQKSYSYSVYVLFPNLLVILPFIFQKICSQCYGTILTGRERE